MFMDIWRYKGCFFGFGLLTKHLQSKVDFNSITEGINVTFRKSLKINKTRQNSLASVNINE